MSGISMTSFCGHQMVRAGDFWVSRGPFTNLDWQTNADRLQADHRRYGVLTETMIGGELRYSLHYLSNLTTLRGTFGHDRVGENFGGSDYVVNNDVTVAAFEFFALEGLGIDRLEHPCHRFELLSC